MSQPIEIMPRLSEKTYALSNNRVYAVNVERSVSKQALKEAMEVQFKVKVLSVNTANIKGKSKRSISNKGRSVAKGRNSDIKKAYITLAEGSTLPFFAAIEEEEKQAEKVQAELTKQQAKEAKKDDKPKRRGLRTKAEAEEAEK
jgi:large subunit ribosomal protein L23